MITVHNTHTLLLVLHQAGSNLGKEQEGLTVLELNDTVTKVPL